MMADHAPGGSAGRIEITGLTKHFGSVVAVQDLNVTVEPGRVTGFLGPNGAGKTTTLRMLLGLVRPSAGRATIGGRPYVDLEEPLREVGADLEGSSFHPGRTARDHLRWVAATHAIAAPRADDMLALAGLVEAADRRVGGYSEGMRQRLALAAAMLGDPRVLVLDEPRRRCPVPVRSTPLVPTRRTTPAPLGQGVHQFGPAGVLDGPAGPARVPRADRTARLVDQPQTATLPDRRAGQVAGPTRHDDALCRKSPAPTSRLCHALLMRRTATETAARQRL